LLTAHPSVRFPLRYSECMLFGEMLPTGNVRGTVIPFSSTCAPFHLSRSIFHSPLHRPEVIVRSLFIFFDFFDYGFVSCLHFPPPILIFSFLFCGVPWCLFFWTAITQRMFDSPWGSSFCLSAPFPPPKTHGPDPPQPKRTDGYCEMSQPSLPPNPPLNIPIVKTIPPLDPGFFVSQGPAVSSMVLAFSKCLKWFFWPPFGRFPCFQHFRSSPTPWP